MTAVALEKMKINLDKIDDEQLLNTRISNLPLQIQGTWLEECILKLYEELEDKDILLRPECYLADEWLTPEKETCIGIPFYLAHPTLIQLEKKIMHEAEGETKAWCMKLLRHEAGHALCYAYKILNRKGWARIFGPPTVRYAETYKYRPYSKNYVRHLDGYYAQYHPEEDFVETFAVWLTPGSQWQDRYKGWKALDKLRYVDKIMKGLQGKQPVVNSKQKFWRQSTLRIVLKNYYTKKKTLWAEEFPDFHDNFLIRTFGEHQSSQNGHPLAIEIIRRHRKTILNTVSRFTGEKKYIIHELYKNIQKRSHQLKLVSTTDETQVVISLSTYISSLIMNYLYTGRFRGEKKKRKL